MPVLESRVVVSDSEILMFDLYTLLGRIELTKQMTIPFKIC